MEYMPRWISVFFEAARVETYLIGERYCAMVVLQCNPQVPQLSFPVMSTTDAGYARPVAHILLAAILLAACALTRDIIS
jgi:hypothetical protein